MPKPLTLEEKLRKSVAAAAPSLGPVQFAKPDEPEEYVPDLREVECSTGDRLRIMRLVADSAALQQQESEIKKQRAGITEMLKTLVAELPQHKFMVDGNRVNYYPTTRKTLNRTKLMAEGVSIQVLNRCTDESVSFSLRIVPPGGKDYSE